MKYVPVFEKDGNRFVVKASNYLADSHEEAFKIGMGAIVESVALGFKYVETTEVVQGMPAVEGSIGGLPIYVISGPLFDGAGETDEESSS